MKALQLNPVRLGQSDLHVTPICLGTMTFGEQVDEATAHAIMDRSLALGVNFIDTAEMYSVPTRAETYTVTESIIGRWLAQHPGLRKRVVLATKVAGPSRGTPWVRKGEGMTAKDILVSCDASLKRLQTDVIDLYQIHWPERHVPAFGAMYYDPQKETSVTPIHDQLQALASLVQQGKVRYIGLSNETPYGVHEFVRLAEQHGLPRIVSVQNPYCLTNRSSLGFHDSQPTLGRLAKFDAMKAQRWGRAESLAAARRYNALARDNGMTPAQMALAFCYTQWRVASTIIGVTSVPHLEENLAAWGTVLSAPVLAQIDAIRKEMRDPAQ
ncbi:MAG: aldo/keto reductase [Betaproteobacteria bacterium]|nr:aldo/keto reductase [Betaproteobacteria bacterium]